MINVRRLLAAVVVATVACIPSQLFWLRQVDIEISFVKDIRNVGEMVLAFLVLDIMFNHRPLSLIRILEALVILESLLIELILRKPHLVFYYDKERKLEVILPLIDDESRLFLFHIVFVL